MTPGPPVIVRKTANAILGFVLISAVSIPTLDLFIPGSDRLVFLPENQWLWPTLLALLALGYVVAAIALLRHVHWAYCAWSQLTLSYLVLALMIGWMRREQGFALERAENPDYPTAAGWAGILYLVLAWLALALLPFALRALGGRIRRHVMRRRLPPA